MQHSLFVNTITTKKFRNIQNKYIKLTSQSITTGRGKKKKKTFQKYAPELDKSSMLDIPADPGQAEDNG